MELGLMRLSVSQNRARVATDDVVYVELRENVTSEST